jgi:hypothetical protein
MPCTTVRRKRVRFSSQQLVAQIAVTVLHVHELEPSPPREDGRAHEVIGQAVEVLVGQDPHRPREAPVKDRVGEGHERFRTVPGIGAAIAAGMRELQAYHEVARSALAEALLVGGDERLPQAGQGLPGRGADHELARVGAAVVAHGGRLPAPHELGAGEAEVPPAAVGQLGRVAVGRPVPAFHGEDTEAVPGPEAVGLEWAGQGRLGRRHESLVEGDRNVAHLEVPTKGIGRPQRRDANPAWIHDREDLVDLLRP